MAVGTKALLRYGTGGYRPASPARFADPERFPAAVARMLEPGVPEHPDDPDHEFVLGMEPLWDGIEALVRKNTGAGAAASRGTAAGTGTAASPGAAGGTGPAEGAR